MTYFAAEPRHVFNTGQLLADVLGSASDWQDPAAVIERLPHAHLVKPLDLTDLNQLAPWTHDCSKRRARRPIIRGDRSADAATPRPRSA